LLDRDRRVALHPSIKSLSIGARRVAGGDFAFRVPTSGRPDEMGELTELFNDMTVKLGRTRALEAQLYNAEKARRGKSPGIRHRA